MADRQAVAGKFGATDALHTWSPDLDVGLAEILTEAARDSRRPNARPHFPVVIPLDEHTDIVVGLTPRQELLKRVFDVVLSVVFGLLALPIIAIIALAVWAMSGRPVLFRQQRIGRGGRPFTLLKFRSMQVDAEEVLANDCGLCDQYRANGFKIPLHEDPRITKVGQFVRRTNVDELPQLWNVLRGDMSLVGPRPVVPAELGEYGPLTSLYCASRPGLTGPWQVYGRYRLTFPGRAIKELSFLCGWTIWSDVKTILLTIPAVLRGGR